MKRTILDRAIGYLSPSAELRRLQSRMQTEMSLRAYDIAQTYSTSDWVSANKGSANSEIKAAIAPGREKSRALAQNNPYALRAIDVIVSNTVGAGIVPKIEGKNSSQTEKLKELWKTWAESTACDVDGRNNFYGLQALAMRATVEAGEGLALKKYATATLLDAKGKPITATVPKIQLLESDFINSKKDEGRIIQGIELDNVGQRVKYHLFKVHPGDKGASDETVAVPAKDVAHVYKQQRPGQVRGVTWAHAVVERLKDLEDYQNATLIRQKIAACFGAVVTTNGSDAALSPSALKAKREREFQLQPYTVRYLNPGEDIKLVSPPAVNDSDFVRNELRAIAAGFGISYESFTGDYSQSNYSSSRMGRLEFINNIESWRWHMLIPQFCEPAFQWFLEWAAMQGVNIEGAKANWTAPAYAQIDPTKEGAAIQRDVRNGFKSWGEAVREQGRDPDAVLAEVVEWNKKFDDAKVSFDSDPRRMSQIGFAQAGDALGKLSEAEYLQTEEEQTNPQNSEGTNSEQENQEDAPGEPDSGSAD